MPYFKCVSYEGPILVCFISLENEKISLKWGPMEQKLVFSTLEKTDDDSCWYTAWPKHFSYWTMMIRLSFMKPEKCIRSI